MSNVFDISLLVQVAVFTVGITQMFKQFLELEHKQAKIILTITIGIIGLLLVHFLPAWIFTGLLGIAGAVIFYDYILKLFEKLFRGAEQ